MIHVLKPEMCPWAIPPDPIMADESWLSLLDNGLCSQCRCVDRRAFSKPLDIVLEGKPEWWISFLPENVNLRIWRKDFIDSISKYLEGFVIGRCITTDGSVIDEYVTCYTDRTLVIRGNRQSKYNICPNCGSIESQVRPGPEYILERYLTDAKVYQDSRCNFFFTEDIAWEINLEPWDVGEQNVYIEPVSVRQTPADEQILPGDDPQK